MNSTTLPPPQGGVASPEAVPLYDANGNQVGQSVEPLFVTIEGAMQLTSLGRDTIWRMRRDDRLPYRQIGRKVLIPLDALKRLEDSPGFKRTQQRSAQRAGWPSRRQR